MTCFALGDGLDAAALRRIYAAHGRLQIEGFLAEESARALHAHLVARGDWTLTANRGEQVVDWSAQTQAGLGPAEHREIARAVAAGGRDGFQFLYHTLRLPRDDAGGDSSPLAGFARFLSSPPVLALLREVTGADDIARADAHATRFGPGQFLTTHDDHIAGRGRRAAYVMNLTPRWRPDWGGLLLFYDRAGNVARGFTPGFNRFNLFAVPQPHGVSFVNPLAGGHRYAVTGWLLGDGT